MVRPEKDGQGGILALHGESDQRNGTPFTPVDPCEDAVIPGTLHLAFTTTGQIDTSRTFVDLGVT
jgi:hypothetical protein